MLIAQGRSGWRQQQLLVCCFVQVFEFVTWKPCEKIGLKMFGFFFLFCVYTSKESKEFIFLYTSESAFSAVRFTVPVFLGYIFHNTLELRG
jgi:hypothetical protein